MTTPIECTTNTTPSSSEEIDRRLGIWLRGRKNHIVLVDGFVGKDLKMMQMTWEEFFFNLPLYNKTFETFIVIKQKWGPLVIWSEKEKAADGPP